MSFCGIAFFIADAGMGGGTLNLQDIKALGIWPRCICQGDPVKAPSLREDGCAAVRSWRGYYLCTLFAETRSCLWGENKQIIRLSLFFHFRGSLICFSLRKSKPGQGHDALAGDWGQNPHGLKRGKAAREKGFTNSILPTPRGVLPAFPPASFLPHKSHSPCHNPCHTPPDLHLPA